MNPSHTHTISNIAALVKVTPLSVYSPTAKLDEMAEDYAVRHGVDKAQLRGAKKLLPADLFAPLKSTMRSLVEFLDNNASPWEDGGWRICQAGKILTIEDGVNERAVAYHNTRDNILRDWYYVEQEMRRKLNGDFDAKKFPTADKVREHLTISMTWKPVPAAGDWRIDVPQSIVDTMEQDTTKQLATQQAKVRARVIDAISCIHKKCTEWDEGTTRIHQTTLDAVAELADVIPGLLITDDPSLVEVCKDASRAMRGIDRDLIRDSGHARASMAEKAAELLKKLGFAQ